MAKTVFLLLAILGTIVPYGILISWIMAHGFDVSLLLQSIVDNKISLFGWADVVISAVVLIIFILSDAVQVPSAKKVMAILATCTIGVSCGLPLYLYFREQIKHI